MDGDEVTPQQDETPDRPQAGPGEPGEHVESDTPLPTPISPEGPPLQLPPPPPGEPPWSPSGWPTAPEQGAWAQTGGWPPVAAPAEPPPRSHRGKVIVAAVVAGLLLLAAGFGIGWDLTRTSTTNAPTSTEGPLKPVPGESVPQGELDLQAIAGRVDPAVVDIDTVINSFGRDGGPFRSEAAGTGMVLTSSGQVLTNNHVISGATSISITIVGRSGHYTATVVGADPTDDVALLQIQGVSGLPTVTVADSSELEIGQQVAAIGNALGRGGTPAISAGTIEALGRSLTVSDERGGQEQLEDLIQTDASVSPGQSGGPMVNGAGQVVGMITAASRVRGQNVSETSFAIPSNNALDIVNKIRAGEESSDIILGPVGFLGVAADDIDAARAAQLGLNVSSGALVVGVVPGSPADRAGIAENAVITAIDGQSVGSVDELGSIIHEHKPGEQITVQWVDAQGSHTDTVTLIAGPAV